jgi:hypothetical protein
MSNWQTLADEMATRFGVDPRLLKATVEAETSGKNVLGDSGRAFGFGQVWIKWHHAKLLEAANAISFTLPSWARNRPKDEAEEQPFKALILGNDRLSMALAALAVKGFWSSASGDWVRFTKGYVGPSIPDHDLERRRKIWQKWSGSPISPPAGGEDNTKALKIGMAVLALVALINE